MNKNPWHWRRVLDALGDRQKTLDLGQNGFGEFDGNHGPAGVPVLGDPMPAAVRVPLRAVLRQAFLAGNREAPLVDALAEVDGWNIGLDGRQADPSRVAIVVPVRGAHDALRLCHACLDAHTPELTGLHGDLADAEVWISCAIEESEQVGKIAKTTRPRWGAWAQETAAPLAFAANVNYGASHSRSEFIVLLNSDAFVGPGWLEALLAPFADPEVVAVGPMGTNVSGHQSVEPWDTEDGRCFGTDPMPADVANWSRQWGRKDRPRGIEPYLARRLVGFCLAVRRSAWDRVGGMDEQFANAYCDDDLSLRLSLVGKCVVVPDLLVLHAGQASFAELPDAQANYNRTLVENQQRFLAKWGWLLPDWNRWNDERGWR